MFNDVKVESGIRKCTELTPEEKKRQILPHSPFLENQQTYCLCETCNVEYKKNRIEALYLKGCEKEFSKYNEEYNRGEKKLNKSADYLIIGWNRESKPICLVLEDKRGGVRSAKKGAKKQIKETIFVLCSLYEKSISRGKNFPIESVAPIIPCFYSTKIDLSTTDDEDDQRQREFKNSTTSVKRHGRRRPSKLSIEMCGMRAELHTLGPRSLRNKEDWENVINQTTPYWGESDVY